MSKAMRDMSVRAGGVTFIGGEATTARPSRFQLLSSSSMPPPPPLPAGAGGAGLMMTAGMSDVRTRLLNALRSVVIT